jgi:hypothetical protein
LHEEDIQASTTPYIGVKGLVIYPPFQIFEFDDGSIDDLKRIELVENPLEEHKFASTSTKSCNE